MSLVLLPLPGNETPAQALAAILDGELGAADVRRFPDGETLVRLLTPVAGRAVALVATLAVGVSLAMPRRVLIAVVAVGVCDVGANVLFALASTRGLVSVVSVLTSLYPAVTVALAAILLHERLGRVQLAGAAAVLAGAALLAAG